mmetsp:Transcript_22196/g.29695  ORF Transcript_22196/g.29695 Transcript_22196/m.29695 type:complete len:103 (+) Transcript_22196:1903-2211(+)
MTFIGSLRRFFSRELARWLEPFCSYSGSFCPVFLIIYSKGNSSSVADFMKLFLALAFALVISPWDSTADRFIMASLRRWGEHPEEMPPMLPGSWFAYNVEIF